MSIYQDKFLSRKFGVLNHYLFEYDHKAPLEEKVNEWHKMVDSFAPEKIARQLHEIGAGYYFITLTQGTRFILAPNATYDAIGGTKPGDACASRDIVAELIVALKKYDIDLCLYCLGMGPADDREVGTKFGIYGESTVNMDFMKKWAAVYEEYSVRYGDGVKAWWIDGCYDAQSSAKFGFTQEYMRPMYDAIKKGNPNALTAFNNGVGPYFYKWFEDEELTSGEFTDFVHIPDRRFYDGAQAFTLIPLGLEHQPGNEHSRWRNRGVRVPREIVKDYIKKVNAAGGTVTIDMYIDNRGNMDDEQVEAMRGLLDD